MKQRLLSASAAGWSKLLGTLVGQILLTPLLLTYWSAENYGIWLLYLSIAATVQILDMGHQNYTANKLLLVDVNDKAKYTADVAASLTGCLLFGAGTAIIFGVGLPKITGFIKLNTETRSGLETLIYVHLLTWLISGTFSATLARATNNLGKYHRFAWWSLALQLASQVTIALSAIAGLDYVRTGIANLLVIALGNIVIARDAINLLLSHGVTPKFGAFRSTLPNVAGSLTLCVSGSLELFRQHGSRILLATYMMPIALASIASMRTVANIIQQGISGVISPLIPEFMRLIREGKHGTVVDILIPIWMVNILLVGPVCLALESSAEYIFNSWTRGKLLYDGIAFGIMTITILVTTMSQTSTGILQGANLVNKQLKAATLSSVTLLAGIWLLTPEYGIRGAAAAMLAAELVSATIATRATAQWLNFNGGNWPKTANSHAILGATVYALAIAASSFGEGIALAAKVAALILNALLARRMWMLWSADGKSRVMQLMSRSRKPKE